jgi:Mg2+ and Co2+ transporter CorA
MKIEVSNGEVLDKYSILQIKSERITDHTALNNIRRELESLQPAVDAIRSLESSGTLHSLQDQLLEVNTSLWEVEDVLRGLEKSQDFGPSFVSAARSVYQLNDRRAAVKKEINLLTGSNLIEEKSYEKYD